MKFLSLSVALISTLVSISSAAAVPLEANAVEARNPQEGQGDQNTWFKDKFCASGYASCGKAGTNGDPGNRCAIRCSNGFGGVALGWCQCSTGWYPDECISLGKFRGRHQC